VVGTSGRNGTGICRNGQESTGMAQESTGMDRNPQKWHRNGLKWSPELNEVFILRIDKQYVSTRVIQDINKNILTTTISTLTPTISITNSISN
jgi:hypothetical protein